MIKVRDDRSSFRRTKIATSGFTLLAMTVENCILVVYRLAFGVVSCYNARSFNLLTSNPSGAAI